MTRNFALLIGFSLATAISILLCSCGSVASADEPAAGAEDRAANAHGMAFVLSLPKIISSPISHCQI